MVALRISSHLLLPSSLHGQIGLYQQKNRSFFRGPYRTKYALELPLSLPRPSFPFDGTKRSERASELGGRSRWSGAAPSASLSLSLFLFLPPSLPLPSRVHKFTFFRLAECDTRPIRAAPSHAANCFLAAASRPLSPSPSPHAFSSLLWERCSKEILPPYSKRCSLFSAVPFLISPIRPKLLTP